MDGVKIIFSHRCLCIQGPIHSEDSKYSEGDEQSYILFLHCIVYYTYKMGPCVKQASLAAYQEYSYFDFTTSKQQIYYPSFFQIQKNYMHAP